MSMNLSQLIQATESNNNSIRSEAENQLLNARNQSPGLFILACSQEFAQKNLNDITRPKAGILIKYTLLNLSVKRRKISILIFLGRT